MGQVKICKRQPLKKSKVYGLPYSLKFFKGCLPQILLGPLVNTWSKICHPFEWVHVGVEY